MAKGVELNYGTLIWLGGAGIDPEVGITINGIMYGNRACPRMPGDVEFTAPDGGKMLRRVESGELAKAQMMVDVIDYLLPAVAQQRAKYMAVIEAAAAQNTSTALNEIDS